MKVKTINRNEEEYTKERSQDLKKVHRNYDPSLHQFQVRVQEPHGGLLRIAIALLKS
jgi:WD repeat and SOF domain-containing protein 1